MHEVSGTEAVCAHEHPLVQSGSEQINRNKWCSDLDISIAELLTEQQLFPTQRAVAMSGNGIAYDATDEHGFERKVIR